MRSRFTFWGLVGLVVVVASAVAVRQLTPWWYARAMRTAPRPLNVLLVTLDTTRADRIGAYGHQGAETPTLDAERNDAPEREDNDLSASGLEYVGNYDDDTGPFYTTPDGDIVSFGGAS